MNVIKRSKLEVIKIISTEIKTKKKHIAIRRKCKKKIRRPKIFLT